MISAVAGIIFLVCGETFDRLEICFEEYGNISSDAGKRSDLGELEKLFEKIIFAVDGRISFNAVFTGVL